MKKQFFAIFLAASATASFAQDSAVDSKAVDPIEAAAQTLIRSFALGDSESAAAAIEAAAQVRAAAEVASLRLLAPHLGGPDQPALGAPESDFTIVEFSDYNCGYCRRMLPVVAEALRANPDLRVVIKEFPILHETSVEAARYALAAARQNAYTEFHFRLMRQGRPALDETLYAAIAEELNLDWEKLRADAADPQIQAEFIENRRLAQALQINGTPAFVAGDFVLRGAVDAETFANLLAALRVRADEDNRLDN